MRRTHRRLLATTAAVGLAAAAALPAAATTSERVVSQPGGDYDLQVRVVSTTDKDGDANPDTATDPDRLLARYTLCGRLAEGTDPGVVRLVVTVDAPGVELDRQFAEVADLETFSCVDRFVHDKVQKSWLSGPYTVTVDADNGRDTASASGTVAIG